MNQCLEIARRVLKSSNKPLSAREIWDVAESEGITKNFDLKGKTPWASVAANLYEDVKKGGSDFLKKHDGKRALFQLKESNTVERESIKPDKSSRANQHRAEKIKTGCNEPAIYPILAKFVKDRFDVEARIIRSQSKGEYRQKGRFRWVYPDVVGVHLPNILGCPSVKELKNLSSLVDYKLFSFEVKWRITNDNHKEFYFQALCNSSWANEAYLVALDVDETAKEELERLNGIFGLGVIVLNINKLSDSEILYKAKFHPSLDWVTINKLSEKNKDFSSFISDILADVKSESGTGRCVYRDNFELSDDTAVRKYAKREGISAELEKKYRKK